MTSLDKFIDTKGFFLTFPVFSIFQVRKTSQAALLVLLEQGLISKADMETKVCPVLLELTEPSSDDDYKIEAVAVRNLSYIFFQAKDLIKIVFELKITWY